MCQKNISNQKIRHLPDEQPPSLVLETVAAGHELAERAGAGEPGLQVQLLGRRVVERARHDVHHAVGDTQQLVEVLRVSYHLVHHLP